MVVINSRGAAYADEAIAKLDHVTPYLITIFGFIGIIDIKFIYFEPTAFSGEEAKKKLFVSPKR